jgi:hypothetical protein
MVHGRVVGHPGSGSPREVNKGLKSHVVAGSRLANLSGFCQQGRALRMNLAEVQRVNFPNFGSPHCFVIHDRTLLKNGRIPERSANFLSCAINQVITVRASGNFDAGHIVFDIIENVIAIRVTHAHSDVISAREQRDECKRRSWANDEFH